MKYVKPRLTATAGLTIWIGLFGVIAPAQAQEKTTLSSSGAESQTLDGAVQLKEKPRHSHYKVIDLGTLGGPHSQFNFGSRVLNDRGTAALGASITTPDPLCLFDFPYCFVFHAAKYERGALTDLGSFSNEASSFADAVNSFDVVAGVSETGRIDSLTGLPAATATIWKGDHIINLGTLGGSFSLANDINDRNQAVGGATNTSPDTGQLGSALTGLPGATQWRAALWHDGTIRDLGTLGDGPDSFAIFINQHGQVTGASYTNSTVNPQTGIPTVDPFFWQDGRMVDLGSLGGVYGSPSGLNNKGQVAGTSNLAGDQIAHPFFWERGKLRDLGTLGGDYGFAYWLDEAGGVVGGATTANNDLFRAFRWMDGHMKNLGSLDSDQCSIAFSSNSRGQVVGNSLTNCDDDTRAFLYENDGPMIDLNSFVMPGSGIILREGVFINEQGEIAVAGRTENGDDHAFLLIPTEERDDDALEASEQTSANTTALTVTTHTPVSKAVVKFATRSAYRFPGFKPPNKP